MSGRFPDFVIIGAMKSATTTLHVQLESLPGFCMSTPKEPNFFSDADQWAKGLDWYKGLFADARPGDLCGESSTHYTKLPDLPDALPRLAEHVPDAKLIYVMRHPIDRLVSHYVHGWSERTIAGPIDEAVDRYHALIDYGRYAMQITPWLEHFGKDRVLPLFFERMLSHPQAELERVCRFLGYEGTPAWQDVRDNVSAERMRTSPLRDAIVFNPLVSFVRLNFIPPSVRERIKGLWRMRKKPVLGDAARARAAAAFDADLAVLGPMLGIELDCVSFKKKVVERPLDWV
jgi:hypothetical protein